MTNSINTNIAAYYAQQNITTANNQSTSSVDRLSSGNAIVEASDNVAGLAVGTSLATQVNALKTAQSNVSQGSSLLQVADGALSQIQTILQQQQSLALQAASGDLTNTDRGFLNQQFQGLSQEINSLTSSTTFNGLNLIDGSLGGQAGLASASNATTSSAATNPTTAAIATFGAGVVAGDTVTVNGVVVTFVAAGTAPNSAAAAGKVIIGASVTATASNVAAYLNSLHDPRVANLQFTNTAGALYAAYQGGITGAVTLTTSTSDTTNITTTGSKAFTATTVPDTHNTNGLGLNRYSALGTTTGSILVDGAGTATDYGTAVDVSTASNNAALIGGFGGGSISNISATYTGTTDTAIFSFTAGGVTYTTTPTVVTGGAAPIALTFTGTDNAGNGAATYGTVKINLKGTGTTAGTLTSQSGFTNYVNTLNNDLSGITITQNQSVTNFQNGSTVSVGANQTATLATTSVQYNTGQVGGGTPQISSVSVTAPAPGSSDAKISVVINGQTYVSGSGIGDVIADNSVIGLVNTSNPSQSISINTGTSTIAGSTTTAYDLSSSANANAFQNALSAAFGLNGSTSGLTFQTGSASNDTLSVQIGSATTASLYNGQSLDVSTLSDATAANTALNTAINTVTALRSNVGALESQFNFASAAIQSSQQNEDSARSDFLDTDIAAESTNYANEQVKLQAGISVLAQANQSTQALLKLIGQ